MKKVRVKIPETGQSPDRVGTSISVVICARNAAPTVEKQLRAITAEIARSQSATGPIELILVDNGSTDATLDIFRKWAVDHDTIQVASEPRSGANRARNAGIAVARSDKILFLDADDEVLPGWIVAMSGVLESSDLVGSDVVIEDGTSNPTPPVRQPRKNAVLWGLASPWGCSSGLRRNVWEAIGGFAPYLPHGGEDMDFFLRAQVCGFHLGWVEEPLLRYTVVDSWSKSRSRSRKVAVSMTHSYWYGRFWGQPRRRIIERQMRSLATDLPASDPQARRELWNLVVCRLFRIGATIRFIPRMPIIVWRDRRRVKRLKTLGDNYPR